MNRNCRQYFAHSVKRKAIALFLEILKLHSIHFSHSQKLGKSAESANLRSIGISTVCYISQLGEKIRSKYQEQKEEVV